MRLYGRTATRVAGDRGLADVAVPFLRRIAQGLHEDRMVGDFHLAEAVVDLVRSLHADRRPSRVIAQPQPARTLERVESFLRANLGDPRLTARRIAAANAISERQLYKLFANEGCSPRLRIRN